MDNSNGERIPDKFLCQCKSGHIFDFRERKPIKPNYLESVCPICKRQFSFWSMEIYPPIWGYKENYNS